MSVALPFLAAFVAGWVARGAVKSHRAYQAGILAERERIDRWHRQHDGPRVLR